MSKKESVNCNFHVDSLEYLKGGDLHLKPNQKYTLVIDYPFDTPGRFTVKTGKKGMGVSGLLPHIYRAYVKYYEVGNWYGHDIGDLVIEGIYVDHTKKLITLGMGS